MKARTVAAKDHAKTKQGIYSRQIKENGIKQCADSIRYAIPKASSSAAGQTIPLQAPVIAGCFIFEAQYFAGFFTEYHPDGIAFAYINILIVKTAGAFIASFVHKPYFLVLMVAYRGSGGSRCRMRCAVSAIGSRGVTRGYLCRTVTLIFKLDDCCGAFENVFTDIYFQSVSSRLSPRPAG